MPVIEGKRTTEHPHIIIIELRLLLAKHYGDICTLLLCNYAATTRLEDPAEDHDEIAIGRRFRRTEYTIRIIVPIERKTEIQQTVDRYFEGCF